MKANIAFISDLHLDCDCEKITRRWDSFVLWAQNNLKELYILGDFFSSWAGDDLADEYSYKVATQIKQLVQGGLKVFFLPGNRDFLLGKKIAKFCGWEILPEQTVIQINDNKILLLHGDELCTKDYHHQRFRWLSRTNWIQKIFLFLPKSLRRYIVNQIRNASKNKMLSMGQVEVSNCMLTHLFKKYNVNTIVHGHVHKSVREQYIIENIPRIRFVLSDWDDMPTILMYNVSTHIMNFKRL